MIKHNGDMVEIDIEEEALIQSAAWLLELKEFCEKRRDSKAHIGYIRTAIDTMQAFYVEHFEKDGEGEG